MNSSRKIMSATVLYIVTILLFSVIASGAAPNPGHPASEISGGTFSANDGNFSFPSGVNVGIGTDSPRALLDVGHNDFLTGGTHFQDGRVQVVIDESFSGMLLGNKNSAHMYGYGMLSASESDDSKFSYWSVLSDSYADGGNFRIKHGTDYNVHGFNTYFTILNGSGNVGIGTTNPDQKLKVDGNVNVTGNITSGTGTVFIDGTNSRVGIGTKEPLDKLHISGTNAALRIAIDGGNGYVFENDNSDNYKLKLRYKDPTDIYKEIMTFEYEGNVGIGTTNPATKLHSSTTGANNTLRIQTIGGGDTTSQVPQLEFWHNYVTMGYTALGAKIYSTSNGGSYTDSRLTIATGDNVDTLTAINGKVGIGTTSPTETLTVIGNMSVDGSTFVVNSSSDRVGIGTPSPRTPLEIAATTGYEMMIEDGGIYIDQIHQNPSSAIRIEMGGTMVSPEPTIYITTSDPIVGNALIGLYDSTGSDTQKLLNITGGGAIISGRVGIGTTGPAYKLDVNGDARTGYFGSSSRIKLTPGSFFGMHDYANVEPINAGGAGQTPYTGTFDMIAFPEIPLGYKATHVTIWGNTTLELTAYECSINAASCTKRDPGTCNTGSSPSSCDITDISYSTTNYMTVIVNGTVANNQEIWGGYITIVQV